MFEVLQIIRELVLLMGLFYFAWKDYKTKLIPIMPLVGFGLIGIILQVLSGIVSDKDSTVIWHMISGMAVGCVLLFISLVTSESIGIGDGLLFLATGVFLEFALNFKMLYGTLFLTGVYGFICLLLKKKGRGDRVAMVPFIFAAYVLFIL